MAAAFGDPAVLRVNVVVPLLEVTDEDWGGAGTPPKLLTRNLTVSGSPLLPEWPLLRLIAKKKVQIMDGIALHFERVFLDNARNENIMRAPGLNVLVPSPVGTVGANLLLKDTAAFFGVCFPPALQKQNMDGAVRLPGVPGTNNYTLNVPQPGCTNDTSAPLLQRCWDSILVAHDFAMAGADIDPNGKPQPNNYGTIMTNVIALCRSRVTSSCLASLGPLGCMLLTQSNLALPPLLPGEVSPPPPAAAQPQPPGVLPGAGHAGAAQPGAAAVTASDGSAGGWSHGSLVAVLTGTIVGGAVLVAAAAVGLTLMHRRRQRGPAQSPPLKAPDVAFVPADAHGHPYTARGGSSDSAGGSGDAGHPASHFAVALTLQEGKGFSCGPSDHGGKLEGGSALASPLPCLSNSSEHTREHTICSFNGDRALGIITSQTPFRSGVCVDVAFSQATGDMEAATHPNGPGSTTASTPNGHGGGGGGKRTAAKAVWRCFTGRVASTRDRQPPRTDGQPLPTAADSQGVPPTDLVRLLPVVLGKGAYGRVYEGEFCGQRVAVKVLLNELVDALNQEDMARLTLSFGQELEVLGRCEHPNIVRLLAASLQPPPGRSPCLVMEYMGTSLDKLLYATPELLPMPLVLHIASEIALGLEYLHPTVLHRDLKPGNVLINDPWGERPIVKLSDFGLSRLRNTILVTKNPEAGTPAYLAPECYDLNNSSVTHKADVYAWGVVLWELLSGLRPWEGLGIVAIAYQVSLVGQRLPVPMIRTPDGCSKRWPPQLCQLLAECWDADPHRRPAAAELSKRLLLLQQQAHRRGASEDSQRGSGLGVRR